jgi:hypothetical protein
VWALSLVGQENVPLATGEFDLKALEASQLAACAAIEDLEVSDRS